MNAIRQLIQFLARLFSSPSGADGPSAQAPPSKGNGAAPPPPPTEAPTPPKPGSVPVTEDPFAPAKTEAVAQPLPPLPLTIREVQSNNKDYIQVQGGEVEVRFRKYKKGLFTVGQNRATDFMENNPSLLADLHLSDSAMRVMFPVSENEGNLDAINTWDNSFLTFGMFQWTIGAKENEGELPALLRKIKEREPLAFESFFGQYGLDVSPATGAVYGFLSLNGIEVKADSRKEQFRSPEWSFRFWHAGQDPKVMAIEIEHAISRLKTFYWKSQYGVAGHPIAEIITSEYGVALILDNHVNRPGYVDNCLRLAVKEAGLDGGNPRSWTTEQEMRVIDAYLGIRETYGKYPMTHAAKRAERTRRYLDSGRLSGQRGSFVYEAGVGGRSLDPADLIGLQPLDYRADDYPAIEHFDRRVEEHGFDPTRDPAAEPE